MQPNLAICVITFNRTDNIIALIHSVLQQEDYEQSVVEFLILNNGSNIDYSAVETLIAAHPRLKIKYIYSDVNLGVPGGRNHLMKLATAPYILIIDDDVEFSKSDDLKRLNTLFEDPYFVENNVGIIALNVHYFANNQPQINAFPHKQYEAYKDKPRFLTGHFIGAANLNKRSAVIDAGYYGEGIFYGMEEYELSFKLIEKGYTIAYDNAVTILHKESPEGRIESNAKHAMMWHNKAMVFWRFLPKMYFYTTNVMWGLRYLLKTKFDFSGWWQNVKKIKHTISHTPREPINAKGMEYIKAVGARLWY